MKLAALLLLALPAAAEPVRAISWDAALALPHRIETFDTLAPRPEPGHRLDHGFRAPGIWIGERLAGQTRAEKIRRGSRVDLLSGTPALPLAIAVGPPGQTLAVATHRGLGSNALFPVGPAGIGAAEGRGEGALALLYDRDQQVIALRLHAEYADPLGQRPAPGHVALTLYARDGRRIARLTVPLAHGPMALAWESLSPVAAVTIEPDDPGGIAVDDVLLQIDAITG